MKRDGQPTAAVISHASGNRASLPQPAPASGRILVLVVLVGVVVYYFCFISNKS